jgi:hypothetical protein
VDCRHRALGCVMLVFIAKIVPGQPVSYVRRHLRLRQLAAAVSVGVCCLMFACLMLLVRGSAHLQLGDELLNASCALYRCCCADSNTVATSTTPQYACLLHGLSIPPYCVCAASVSQASHRPNHEPPGDDSTAAAAAVADVCVSCKHARWFAGTHASVQLWLLLYLCGVQSEDAAMKVQGHLLHCWLTCTMKSAWQRMASPFSAIWSKAAVCWCVTLQMRMWPSVAATILMR